MLKKLIITVFSIYCLTTHCSAMNNKEYDTLKPTVKKTSYLNWNPVLKASDVFKDVIKFNYLQANENELFWIEQRPSEGGRSVLVKRNQQGVISDLTPAPYSVKTRVYEYGGSPYTIKGPWIYFANFSDQRIYRQNKLHLSEIIPLTPQHNSDGSLGKYMDLTVSPDGNWLVFVYEKEVRQGEHPNYLATLNLNNSQIQEPTLLVKDADFYMTPKFSPDKKHLAWLEWNHPYMPWDSTKLYLAEFKEGKIIENTKIQVAGSNNASISSFTFLPNGNLYFTEDFANKKTSHPKNYYNIYCYKAGKTTTVTKDLGDFQFLTAAETNLLTIFERLGEPKLLLINPNNGERKELANEYIDFKFPIWNAGIINLAGFSASEPSALLEIKSDGKISTLKKSTDYLVEKKTASRPIFIEFPTKDGGHSYGYYYSPLNPNYQSIEKEKAPVRVLVHGGPVGRTSKEFTLSKLFWTSQGMAIFDVNYRGSTGFGRHYRDALKNKWGILEIQDVKDGLTELKKRGLISDQAVVSGGSAGGYTVERLLTYYPDLFAAGATYFGVGNLVTLQASTHKFESHYLEQLIGGTLQTNLKEYQDRSPINHLDKLKAPMIIFQGTDDKVVPPENSREVARLLKSKGIYYEYYEYSGEAHGFQNKINLIDSLEKESLFFKKVLKNSHLK